MKIILSELKEGFLTNIEEQLDPKKLDLEFTDLKYCDALTVKGTVEKGHDTVIFRGRMISMTEQTCGRCLIAIKKGLDHPFELFYETRDKEFIEPLDDLREILILDHPIRFICREDCKGLCPNCGTNLNEKKCACNGREQSRPFTQLRDRIDEGREKSRGKS